MPRYVAFLRGMNLGRRRIAMSELKRHFEQLGFSQVETFIASGNVLLSSSESDTDRLETNIATYLETKLGYKVDTFVRTLDGVVAIGAGQPFPEDGQAGFTIHVGFMREKLSPAVARKLASVRTETDQFRVDGRELYWLCRGRTSDSTVWQLPEVKELRLPTLTMRNMTSVRKLLAKHGGDGSRATP